ncbi:flagellar biosynthetic protein FliO [Acetitomaculum ruminis]|nr:flagellar biosynthetic protein FliO [Acetitomaculum ruminis]
MSWIDSIFQFIQVLFIFVVVLALTYFTTRWLANYQKKNLVDSEIEVLDMGRLTANKYIQVVKVGDRYLVLGISKDEITMLTELTSEEAKVFEKNGERAAPPGFDDVLKKVKATAAKFKK